MTKLALHRRPSLLEGTVFNDIFDNVLRDFPQLIQQSTQGYPVSDIWKDNNGNTIMEFALAGFSKDEISLEVLPNKKSITVSANSKIEEDETNINKRIARRSFKKSYVDYDNNLDFGAVTADYENGLLRVVIPTRPEVKPLMIEIQ
jgi:HSP20 family molecular chaperone IbpA